MKMAGRDARAGLEWQHCDPECKGLMLRVRDWQVSWTFGGASEANGGDGCTATALCRLERPAREPGL